jgi:phage gp16-like protein
MTAAAARKPAFAPNPHRRAMLAKVHLAKKQLGLMDDDYRAVLMRVTGQISAADCSDAELSKLLAEMQRQGFRPKVARATPAAADSPLALKARALWISLHHLGVVANVSEQALEAFARRQLKVERLQWANQAQGYKLVEALKAMAERAGWDQSVEGVKPHMRLTVLKRRLVEAIVGKLKEKGLAAKEWTVTQAAWSLLGERLPAGILFADVELLDRLARGFGATLRGDRA